MATLLHSRNVVRARVQLLHCPPSDKMMSLSCSDRNCHLLRVAALLIVCYGIMCYIAAKMGGEGALLLATRCRTAAGNAAAHARQTDEQQLHAVRLHEERHGKGHLCVCVCVCLCMCVYAQFRTRKSGENVKSAPSEAFCEHAHSSHRRCTRSFRTRRHVPMTSCVRSYRNALLPGDRRTTPTTTCSKSRAVRSTCWESTRSVSTR